MLHLVIESIVQDQPRRLVELLEHSGLSCDHVFGKMQRSLLQVAASVGSADCLLVLAKRGANVNMQDISGVTATALAARNGHKRCLRILVFDFHADIALVDSDGWRMR